MRDKSLYIVYLNPAVTDDRWSTLHRFFHPGILDHDKRTAIVCFSLDISHHVFLSAKVRDFSTDKNKKVHLPYNLVDVIIELETHKDQLGFLPEKESPAPQEEDND